MVSIVVAHSTNRVIGNHGKLPWHIPADLARFRELTIGQTVVMGRKTFESLPDAFRPLPERRNLVVSANPSFRPPGAEVVPTLEAALDACGGRCVVVGGGAIYAQALALADRVYATHVAAEVHGDTYFPELSEEEWRCVDESDPQVENDYPFLFRTYDRTS